MISPFFIIVPSLDLTHMPLCLPLRLALTLFLSSLACTAWADEDDTRQLLNKIDRTMAERERAHRVDTDPAKDNASLITIEGRTYNVQNTLEDLGPAIYVTLNLRQWSKVRQFVERYRQLPGHEPALVSMAEGMLARQDKHYGQAIASLRRAVAQNPSFARAKLELARALFEDNQSREAKALFDEVAQSTVPEQVVPVLEGYQGALRERDSWHGSVSMGTGYNSNINQGNGMTTRTQVCSFFECIETNRKMPVPIRSSSLVYDAVAERRFQIEGNHHLLVRGLSYGNYYHRHKEDEPQTYYDDNTSVIYVGYNYLSALDDVSVSPLFESYWGDRHNKYQATGLRTEWKHTLTERLQLIAQAQQKHFRFQGRERDYFENYDERMVGGSASYLLGSQTLVYGGLTYTRRTQPQVSARNKEYMASLGLYRMFDVGINLNATALYRRTRYDEADTFLGGLREDRQQIYIANLAVPRFKFAGLVPSLYVKRTVNASSIDWAYTYRQTEVALKVEKSF